MWQIPQMTTTAGDYKQSNNYDNDNDNDDKTPAKGQERFNRENSNKRRCRVGNDVSFLICTCGLGHELEVGLGFGFPRPRCCRFTIEFLIGSAGTHTHTHTYALGIEKHLNLMAVACTLYGPRERTRSRLESELRPGALTAFCAVWWYSQKAATATATVTDPLKLLAKCKVGIKGSHTCLCLPPLLPSPPRSFQM